MKAIDTLVSLFVLSQLTACAVASVDDDSMLGAAGSPPASGGTDAGSGGVMASGGATGGSLAGVGGDLVGVGGGSSSGGASGGMTATGGTPAAGGMTSSGGSATGGAMATGGEPATGGHSGTCSAPAWDPLKTYPGSGTQVSLDGTIYENCYYANAGDDPSQKNDGTSCTGQPWKIVGPCS